MAVTASLLIYDIPESSEYPNPSGFLRRRAIRINLSCWCIPDHAIPWHMLGEMTQAGCTWHTVRFSTEEMPKLSGMCIDALRKEIGEALAGAKICLDNAEDRADEEIFGEDPEKAAKQYRNKVRAAVRRTNRLINDLQEAARQFEIDPETLAPGTARNAVTILGATAQRKIDAYLQMAAEAGAEMQGAAEQDAVPAEVLCDFLEEEKGIDCSEQRLLFRAGSLLPCCDDPACPYCHGTGIVQEG